MKQAEVCARYHINAGRSATSMVATDSVFLFKGQSETWLSFPFRNLRKELKELEKIKSYTGIWNVEKSCMQSMTLTYPSRYLYTDYMVCDYGIYHHSVWGYSPTFHD